MKNRTRTRPLQAALGALRRTADAQAAQPPPRAPMLPHGTDWSWRPELWQRPLAVPSLTGPRPQSMMGLDITVFHDCERCEFALRQARNPPAVDRAPFGLHLDVFAFKGSFLSLVLDLPKTAIDGLTRQHLVRLDTGLALENPAKVFARLHVIHGPNTGMIVRELPAGDPEPAVEFDLAYTDLNEKRLERAWIELIFETPHESHAVIHDIMVSRRLRAAL